MTEQQTGLSVLAVDDEKPALEELAYLLGADSRVSSIRTANGAAEALRSNEDVREFDLGVAGADRRSFKSVKTYRRRKRWLA